MSLWFRYRYGAEEAVVPWGIVLSGLILLLLLYTGWKGGNLVYHHRIGIHPEDPADRSVGEYQAKTAWTLTNKRNLAVG